MQEKNLKYSRLIQAISSTRRKENFYLLVENILKTVSITMLIVLIASVIESIANGDIVFRGILAGIAFTSFIIMSGLFIGPAIAKGFGIFNQESFETLAYRIGNAFPDIKDRLSNALQLFKNISVNRRTSGELALAAFDKIAEDTRDRDFDVIIDKSGFRKKVMLFMFVIVFVSFFFGIFQDTLGSSFYRIINFNKSFLPPAPFTISIDPVSKKALRGEKAVITVKATGKAPQTVTLLVKEEKQDNYDSYVLRLDTGLTYKYEIPAVKQTITFYAQATWLNTPIRTVIGKIQVSDKPMIRSITGTVVFPSYTKLASRSFMEDNADISAIRGSRIELQVLANKNLSSARIIFEKTVELASIDSLNPAAIASDTLQIPLSVSSKNATGSFRISSSGTYYISLTDEQGETNADPIKYKIIVQEDGFPSISIIEPKTDVQVSDNALLPVRVGISDDFGFSKLMLHYKLVSSKYAEPDKNYASIQIPILNNDLSAEVPYLWDLNKLGMTPEDKYEYYLEVFDNDAVSGPKSAKTQILSVRLPSLDEVLDRAEETQKNVEKELEKVLKEASDVQKDMQELNKELLKSMNKKELDWKDKKKAEDIMKKQQELKSKVAQLQENMQNITEKLQQSNVLSPETVQKYMELQKLMSEVNSPELQRMQQKMEQALQQLSPEQLQKAMKDMQFDEEKFKKSIERTLKILKRLQAEQKIDALTKMAEDLKEKQDELQKQAENANASDKQKQDELAQKQKGLKEDLDKIAKELNDLEKLMKEIGEDMPLSELQKAEDELKTEETSKEMQNAGSQMQQGNMNQAKKSQSNASKNLQNFANQMKNMKQKMADKSSKEAMKKLQKAISDMLKLSEQQESLKESTQSADYNSTQIPDYAESQSNMLEALTSVANAMLALSEKSFAITPEMGKSVGDALQQMQSSIEELANRRPSSAAKSQGEAMSSMNQAVSQMQDMLSAMQNQNNGSCNNPGGMGQGQTPGGMSLGDKLQQMAAQQQAINQAMQQMMQSGGKMTMEQQAEYGKITQEQGKARKSMQEMADEQKKFAPGDKKIMGDLNKIADEMKEVVSDLQSGNINQETLNRQERILSRLLDATRSINDRDYEKKRESKSGKDYTKQSPGSIDMNSQEGKTRAFQEMLRSIQQGYTKDYELLIKRYFEALQNNDAPAKN